MKKKATPKIKVVLAVEGVEEDMEDNLDNIMAPLLKKNRKVTGDKKIPTYIIVAPLDNISFHFEEIVLKWKNVYHRRITPKRELSKEALKCEEIFELLDDAQIMKIVRGLSPYYIKLDKKFIINIHKNILTILKEDITKRCIFEDVVSVFLLQ